MFCCEFVGLLWVIVPGFTCSGAIDWEGFTSFPGKEFWGEAIAGCVFVRLFPVTGFVTPEFIAGWITWGELNWSLPATTGLEWLGISFGSNV